MLNVVFMGTPEIAVPALESLNRFFKVVGVFTQPDRPSGRGMQMQPPPVKKRALELDLKVFQPEKLSAPGNLELLQELKPDVIVVAAYAQLLKKNVLDLPRLGCVNIHFSLLPRWRGAAPVQWAILEGDAKTGVCTMNMVEKLDAGAVYETTAIPIGAQDTTVSLSARLADLGAEQIVSTLQGLEKGKLQAVKQDESQANYAKKLSKEDEALDWKGSAIVLDRRIRALQPWPGTSVWLKNGMRLRIKSATVYRDRDSKNPGTIHQSGSDVLMECGQGALNLKTVQWDGKKEFQKADFVNSLSGLGLNLPLELGDRPHGK